VKGTFWKFYSAARRQAYTKKNIVSTFCATGIHPFNPDAITRLIIGGTNSAPTSAYYVSVSASAISSQQPADILTQLKTPRKSCDVRQ
jgi:hypothetical protein